MAEGRRWRWRLAHVPALLAASGVLLVAAGAGGWLAQGGPGAAGAAAGVGVVTASYLLSTLVIAWADRVNPNLVLPVGLLTYAVKFTVIAVATAAVVASGWDGLAALGVGVVAAVVGWTGTQIWWVVRHPPQLDYPDRSP